MSACVFILWVWKHPVFRPHCSHNHYISQLHSCFYQRFQSVPTRVLLTEMKSRCLISACVRACARVFGGREIKIWASLSLLSGHLVQIKTNCLHDGLFEFQSVCAQTAQNLVSRSNFWLFTPRCPTAGLPFNSISTEFSIAVLTATSEFVHLDLCG